MSKYHLIFYTASWCGPCQKAHGQLDKDVELNKMVVFESVDPDKLKTPEEKEFIQLEGIEEYPTFVLYKELKIGNRYYLKEIGRFSGYTNKGDFMNSLKNIMK